MAETHDETWKSSVSQIIPGVEIIKRFPNAQAPGKGTNPRGERTGDISTLYTLRFSENEDIDILIRKVASISGIRSAEPHYLPVLCYVPSDDSISEQYALNRIQAFAGWDLHRGDTNMVIGITDTGVEIFHPDIYPSIAINYDDPPDGIDNDSDGYTDNYYGWDSGDNDGDPGTSGSPHGQHISGIASATADNNQGIAGSGFNCRFIPVKIMNSSGQLSGAYEGLVYAAEMGCKVINCSWGGYQYSSINEEIIRYVSVNLDCIVFCGAGNDNNERLFYPASYPYAVSIGASDAQDLKADFSNFGSRLDLFAPGDLILSTWTNGGYARSGGTSMSSPLTAGCAAILRSAYPQFSGQQILYQLRTTADPIDLLTGNSAYAGKMGSGRVNLFRALSEAGHSAVVFIEPELLDLNSELFLPGDTVSLSGNFINYLANAGDVHVSLSCPTGNLELLNPERNLGSLGTLEQIHIQDAPFLFVISQDVAFNEDAQLKLNIQSDGTTLTQTFPLRLYADFININHNEVNAGIGGSGKIGVSGNQYLKGLGIRPEGGINLMYEGGLMFSPSEGLVVDGVRGNSVNNDWQILERFIQQEPFGSSTVKYRSAMQSVLPGCDLFAETRLFADSLPQNNNFIVLDYTLTNTSPIDYTECYLGIFADWDIGVYARNRALYNESLKLHYVFEVGADSLFAGIQILGSAPAIAHSIENIGSTSGPVNASDGLTEDEKRQTLSISHPEGGLSGEGTDIISVTSAGPFSISSGNQIRAGFAIHLAHSETELLQQAAIARTYYFDVVTPLGISDSNQKLNTPVIYPNPTSGKITVNTHGELIEEIRIYDLSGHALWNHRPQAGNELIQLPSEIKNGSYILKIKSHSGWRTERIIVLK
ncbi:MAG: S8 family peptidase [Bacteroidetes bacterium]|nr:S8 family peptidase [Bacteroidota bacterium]